MILMIGTTFLSVLPFSSAPFDYSVGSFDVMIPAGAPKVTFPVSTLTDNLVEGNEYFKATLSLPSAPEDVVVGSPNMAFVTIVDDDGMFGIISFIIMHAPLAPNHSAISIAVICSCVLLIHTVSIPVRFRPADYSVKEGADSNAVITLEALADHPNFDFSVTMITQDGSANRKYLHSLQLICAYIPHYSVHTLP